MKPSARTRLFALLGQPVAHSLSPRMQNAAFAALGLDAVYAPLACASEAVPALMQSLAAAGGGGNVTVPHKRMAASVVTLPDEPRDACNTFWGDSGALAGANTDVDGILGALAHLGALESPTRGMLIIGTGGSAAAAAVAAARSGARLAVRSRSPERAARFMANATAFGAMPADFGECDIVINATPLGLGVADPLPLLPDQLPRARFALDLVYASGETPWVRAMREAGARAADGREVLVRQGGASFERWFPGLGAPLEIMRAAVRGALG